MKRNWKDIKWIFEPDGSLIDLYVQEVSLEDWKKLIALINEKYIVKFDDKNKISENYAIEYLTDETGKIESRSASIFLGDIQLNCHFFLVDQIEFDIDPKKVNSMKDFELIEGFMIDVSIEIDNQITLTDENNPEFPLIKIDPNRKINKILTQNELKQYWKKQDTLLNKIKTLKTEFEMKFMSKKFSKKLLNSASELYTSTKKDENVW
jgi:hypothetical protein